MIKTILVPATANETDGVVFEAALSVARMFCAHLHFLHVQEDPLEAIAAMGSADIGGTMAAASLVDGWTAEARRREEWAEGQFRSFCDREHLAITHTPSGAPDVSVEWHHEVGREPGWVVDMANRAICSSLGARSMAKVSPPVRWRRPSSKRADHCSSQGRARFKHLPRRSRLPGSRRRRLPAR